MPFFIVCTILLQLFLAQDGMVTAISKDLRPIWNEMLNKRSYEADWATYSSLELQRHEHLFYGSAPDLQSFMLANLTIYAADSEKIISMNRFAELLESVHCNHNIELRFKSKTNFEYAVHAWNWVNRDKKNSFIMIANYGICGSAKHRRQPYNITGVHYDELNFVAYLHSKEISWKEAAHTFDLDFYRTFGPGIDPTDFSTIEARDITFDPSWTLDLTHNFSQKLFSKTIDELTLTAECLDCSTRGSMVVTLHVSVSLGGVQDLTISLSPLDLAATLDIQISAQGSLNAPYSWHQRLGSITIGGFTFEDIVTLDAVLNYDVGFSTSSWQGVSTVSFGVIANLSNTAVTTIDLKNSKRSSFSGWTPTFQHIPISVDASVSGDVSVYSQPSLALKVTVADVGFEIGLDCRLPEINAHIEGLADSNGVCDSNKTLGVSVDSTFGVDFFLSADLTTDPSSSLFNETIYTNTWPFIKTCLPLGPDSQVSCASIDQIDIFDNPEVSEYWNTESIGSGDHPGSRKRVPDASPRTYKLSCRPANLVRVQDYPGPSNQNSGISDWLQPNNCKDCKDWRMINVPRPANTNGWATEHIYEGVWIRQFLDSISNNPNNPNLLGCDQVVKLFWGIKPQSSTTNSPNWMTEVMKSIGNNLRKDLMVFLVQDLNTRKFNVFNGDRAIGNNRFNTATTEEKICLIAMIGRIMVYMNHPIVNPKLQKTASSVEDTLARMAAEIQASDDAEIKALIPANYDLTKVHRQWLRAYVKAGSQNAQNIISTLARNAMSSMASAAIPPTETNYRWFSAVAASATVLAPAVTGI